MFRPARKWLHSLLLRRLLLVVVAGLSAPLPSAQEKTQMFRVIAIAEHGGIHKPFVDRAKIWLDKLAADNNFAVDYIEDTEKIDEAFLAKYKLFIQLNYPPYNWTDRAQAAFIKYIDEGKGGWIGFHHATLLGEFDGYQMWPWFYDFMGGIHFKNYIATFVTGKVTIEDKTHPAMKGILSPFTIKDEEFYTLRQAAARERPRAGQRGRKDVHAQHRHKNGRPSGRLDQRAQEGGEHLHLHGPSSGPFRQQSVHPAL